MVILVMMTQSVLDPIANFVTSILLLIQSRIFERSSGKCHAERLLHPN